MLHVYDTVFHGFSARLTEQEASVMESMQGVVTVFPDQARQLQTTRTPQFLGLDTRRGIWPKSNYGSDVIIGVLDTGVWPESRSFRDRKIGSIPKNWKGECEEGPGFSSSLCNRKLVGARFFLNGYEAMNGPLNESVESRSPRDTDGHGTHTASTAAGRYVNGANLLGYAAGMARGVAPKSRIAAYKVCWSSGCFDSDILAAFDRAIADGVHVISASVGGGVVPYYMDSISIGAFGAASHGVFVAASGGNQGPSQQTVTNVSPWIATIGASTVDRNFPAEVKLGNGMSFAGASLYSGPQLKPGFYPLADSTSLGMKDSDTYSTSLCMEGSLDPKLVKGKIVLCSRGSNPRAAKGEVVRRAGGAGMILANSALDGEGLVSDAHLLPAAAVGYAAGVAVRHYIASERRPTATIVFIGTILNVKPAPILASFSSRGPNPQTTEILKPDLIAPGVDILAAWTGAVGPSGLPSDRRTVEFNIISGTSMACPHVSGVAALLKSSHPNWSPAAIRSALMTTAYTEDNRGAVIADEATSNSSTPLDFGAGHVDPQKAMDPGLVYDIEPQDYVDFLCSLKYSEKAVHTVTRYPTACANATLRAPGDLNYPSFSASFDQNSHSRVYKAVFRRTLTNVGPANSSYVAAVVSPPGASISARPARLTFSSVNQKLPFRLYVSAQHVSSLLPGDVSTIFGSITWKDGTHVVQSPVVIVLQQPY
ncbi:hypothetical protein KP509_12G079200 [Ceratopteris richardii]|uniref:Uncharacterized protein n=1 Tax=Ceratopteris richardii TaxID=49495 RepID=A0A8T2TN32_CERRI|nr:hypothetical protein KP509_12G079200 [Ceratopteris richardii]